MKSKKTGLEMKVDKVLFNHSVDTVNGKNVCFVVIDHDLVKGLYFTKTEIVSISKWFGELAKGMK